MNIESQNDRNTILIVDDDATNLKFIQEILKDNYKIYAAPSGERALLFLQKKTPDLILLDIEMPGMNGYEVIMEIKRNPVWGEIPVIFLTGQDGRDKEEKGLALGAVDYITKPISPGVVKARVALHMELRSYRKNLEQLVENKTAQIQKTQDSVMQILSDVTAYRDNETGAHIKRTTLFCRVLVDNLLKIKYPGYVISKEYAENIVNAAKIHDMGKVAVPDGILLKPGRLTQREFEIIKMHTIYGAKILESAIENLGDDSFFLFVARELIETHHERWDGTGYPKGLMADEIPVSGRVMALADVYDALISRRPYKEPFSHEEALKLIFEESGDHFDPVLLEISEEVMAEFAKIAKEYRDEEYYMKMLV